ncbi:MAG: TonB-dependent receptor [Candidatus Cloacimonetes bacterium]|nr:TonB-dependent receptor [Candidatus Cloacimonadota bacterium]
MFKPTAIKPPVAQTSRLCLLLILLIAHILLSAQQPDTLKTAHKVKYHLEGASIVAEKPTQAIGNIETRTWASDEIITELNLADAVDEISGLNISRGGKGGSDLSIRGFAKEDVTVMIDGRPLGGGYFDAVDLSAIPAAEIKEIQVIKGPVSALYGSNTMGGVVNIITRKPQNDAWLKAALQLQRNNTRRLQLSSAHSFNTWDYLVSLSDYYTAGFPLSEDFQPQGKENGGIRDNSAQKQNDLQTRLNWDFGDFHKLGISASYTWMDFREIPLSIHPPYTYQKFVDWKRYQMSANGIFQFDWNQKLNLNLYYDGYDDIYHTYQDPEYSLIALNSRLLSNNIGFIARYDLEHENYDLIAGYRGERQAYDRKDNGGYTEWTGNWQLLQNPFLQLESRLAGLTVTAGCGISFFHQHQRNNWIYHLEPSLGFFYEDCRFAQYNLAFSNNVNYPSLHELFSSSSGNENLKEESAWKYEISTRQPFNNGSIALSMFYNQIDNMVEKAYVSPYNEIFVNIDQVQSYGLEATLNWKFLLEHTLEYRYLDYTTGSDRPLNENPQNIVTISEKANLPWKINLEYTANWQDISVSESHTISAHWLHNAYLSRSFKNYNLKLGLENIFDVNYEEKYGYPQPGFDFILSIEVKK